MKKILFLLLMFFLFVKVGFSQNRFHYLIKIEGVTDLVAAKESAEWLRNIFEVYPTFNDTTDCFDFYSSTLIDSTKLSNKGIESGYEVNYFYRAANIVAFRKLEDE